MMLLQRSAALVLLAGASALATPVPSAAATADPLDDVMVKARATLNGTWHQCYNALLAAARTIFGTSTREMKPNSTHAITITSSAACIIRLGPSVVKITDIIA